MAFTRQFIVNKILGMLVSSWLAEGQNQWQNSWRWGRALQNQQHWKKEGMESWHSLCRWGRVSASERWPERRMGEASSARATWRWNSEALQKSLLWMAYATDSGFFFFFSCLWNVPGCIEKWRWECLFFCPEKEKWKWNTWITEGNASGWGFFFLMSNKINAHTLGLPRYSESQCLQVAQVCVRCSLTELRVWEGW